MLRIILNLMFDIFFEDLIQEAIGIQFHKNIDKLWVKFGVIDNIRA